MKGSDIVVKGKNVDHESRCAHYHKEVDIVAIQFACCEEFYACITCHVEESGHEVKRWSRNHRNRHAILCGHCKELLTINEYTSTSHCPACSHAFNEGCASHYPLYFDMDFS